MYLQIHLFCFHQIPQQSCCYLGSSKVAKETKYAIQKLTKTRCRDQYILIIALPQTSLDLCFHLATESVRQYDL